MTPHQTLAWLRSDWTHVVVFADGVVFLFVLAWSSYKSAYYTATGKALKRTRFVLAMDIIAAMGKDGIKALNNVLVMGRSTSLLLPALPLDTPARPPVAPPEVTP